MLVYLSYRFPASYTKHLKLSSIGSRCDTQPTQTDKVLMLWSPEVTNFTYVTG